jgi:hypothetical protein
MTKISRRSFLTTTSIVSTRVLFIPGLMSFYPNKKLNISFIVNAGRASTHLELANIENDIALCGLSQINSDEVAVRYPKAKQFKDYRVTKKSGEIKRKFRKPYKYAGP